MTEAKMNDPMRTKIPKPRNECSNVGQSGIMGVSQAVCAARPLPSGATAKAVRERNERLKALAKHYGQLCYSGANVWTQLDAWKAFVIELERKQ